MRSIDVAVAAILAALAIAIPLLFAGTLQISIPAIGYSATLASHVPRMLPTLFGPIVTAFVGAASSLGFFATLGPVVGARAATHIIWGVVAAIAIKKGMSYPKALFIVALPLHALLEGAVVIAFGIPWQASLITIGGTALQHVIDSIISIIVVKAAWPFIKAALGKRGQKSKTQ
ncbi:MAG: ECF transporter S component [Candidatus Bathyarchaeota archaeon]|nr:ECF transporter S component [Candidatus Bathyarchaeota archaeon]